MRDFVYTQTPTHWVFAEQDPRKKAARQKVVHYPKACYTLPEAYRDWEHNATNRERNMA